MNVECSPDGKDKVIQFFLIENLKIRSEGQCMAIRKQDVKVRTGLSWFIIG